MGYLTCSDRKFCIPQKNREMSGCLLIATSGWIADNALCASFMCECTMPCSYIEVKKFNTEVTDGALAS